jgi:hypothetical protein
MGQTKYTICDICGESVKARGIGGHKALKHGIVVKTVIRDKSTRVNDTSNDMSTHVKNTSPHTSNMSTQVKDTSTRVQRPSDYVRKKSTVIETKIEPAVKNIDIHHPGTSVISDEGWSLHQRIMKVQFRCKNCGHYCVPDEFPDSSRLNTGCLPGKQHEA